MHRKWLLIFILLLLATLVFAPAYGQQDEKKESEVNFGMLSLLPPFLAITLAFITKEVVVSLFLGVLSGAIMMNGGNLFGGYLRALDHYILGAMADPWHAGILIFSFTIGGMVGIITRMGGTQAVAEALAKLARNSRGAQIVTGLLGCAVFFDDYSNTLIVGPTMRPLCDKMRVSREKLSYIVDATSAPVAGIALMSTWIGYEISLIKDVYDKIGEPVNAYAVFLQTIPYRFYEIFTLFMVFALAYMMRDFGPMYEAEIRARKTGKVLADGARPMSAMHLIDVKIREGAKPRIINAAVPVISLIVLGFVSLWYNGGGPELPLTWTGIREAFGKSDTSVALIWAATTATIITIGLAVGQKLLTLREAMEAWVDGVKALTLTGVIQVLAWALGSVTEDVKAAEYLIQIASSSVNHAIIPALVFFVSCIISFATGTSWGTMAIVIPLALPLAHAVNPQIMLPTMGSVLAGAIFGDHCSPISDTTIMSSMASSADHLDHVKTQVPYAVTSALVALLIGYIPAGFGMPVWVSLIAGAGTLYGIIKLIGRPVDLYSYFDEPENRGV
ncbi:Malate-2H(+)/Na(+)-lactate antiporter [Fervidicola ferrireducens]|uniref:Malate-2H(+)/Na(+)-lactate antiporter n=1 Tax=Fervidicola ferrireducens TaxID=520764 RepID=A0A140LDS7_9FIRM|nr:Na+/H+ antiporter NhaC family protein [Fervidicola ferrireducens]KXG78702.1 Malate-2H(+)/Na(+)-lactate antiporter [Fervidicola ferrireducens]